MAFFSCASLTAHLVHSGQAHSLRKAVFPSRLNSLRKNDDFRAVFEHGRRYVNKGVALYVWRRPAEAAADAKAKVAAKADAKAQAHAETLVDRPGEIGFAVSRKAGNAVKRNRLRRRLREAFRRLDGELRPGYAVVAVPRAAAASLPWPELAAAVHDAAKRSGAWAGL